MSEKKPRFPGPMFGFMHAKKLEKLNVADVEQCMSALLTWTADQLQTESVTLEETTVFLEIPESEFVLVPSSTSVLYHGGTDIIGRQLKNMSFSGEFILFIGSHVFLQESAKSIMSMLTPPQEEKYDDVRLQFQAEVDMLSNQAANLLPGEVCRFGLLQLGSQRLVRSCILPIMMHHLHHVQQFDGTEAAEMSMAYVQEIS